MEASGDHESDLGFSNRKAKVEEDTQTEEDESKTKQNFRSRHLTYYSQSPLPFDVFSIL